MVLQNKVVVVSGGSRGIGRAAAEVWSEQGAVVVIVARHQPTLEATARALRAAGGEVHALAGDVSRPADAERLRSFLADMAGRVDLLFNNAAITPPEGPLHELTPEQFTETVAINLTGPWLLTRALLDLLAVVPGSQVLNVTSGYKAQPGYGVYSITKTGIDSLTQVQAVELADRGIRVNTFNPGRVRTDMAPDAARPVDVVKPLLLEIARHGADGPTGQEFRVRA